MKPGPKPKPWLLPLNLRCTAQEGGAAGNSKRCHGEQGHKGAHFHRNRKGEVDLVWTRRRRTAPRHVSL